MHAPRSFHRFAPACLALLLLGAPVQASAYTDPGSGALVLQLAMSALAGFLFYFRKGIALLWRRKDHGN